MSPTVKRTVGILMFVVAATIAVLNLSRFGGLGVGTALPAVFICLGAALVVSARKQSR